MNISESIEILKKEQVLGRTPMGRTLSNYAKESISAALEDEKNYSMDVIQCLGCGFIISNLLITDGCPNCGAIDMSENIRTD